MLVPMSKMQSNDVRHVGIRLDPALYKRLAVMAALNDRTKQEEVRLLIEAGVEKFEAKMARAA